MNKSLLFLQGGKAMMETSELSRIALERFWFGRRDSFFILYVCMLVDLFFWLVD